MNKEILKHDLTLLEKALYKAHDIETQLYLIRKIREISMELGDNK